MIRASQSIGLVAALALTVALAPNAAAATKGMNLPWMASGSSNYGHDIGANYDVNLWKSWFAKCKAIQSYHIRIWLHEGWEGLTGSAGSLNVTSTFQNNLYNLSQAAGAAGVSIEWVILNGAADTQLCAAVAGSSGGRSNFNSNVVAVDRSKTWGSGVDYFDLIQEYNYSTSNANAKALADACGSAGSRTCSYDGNGSAISGYTKEFHVYSNNPTLPSVNHIGEFGPTTKTTAGWQQAIASVWTQAKSKGIGNVMPWKANDTGDGWSLYNGGGTGATVKTEGTYWANYW